MAKTGKMQAIETEIAIVGAGLSGLAIADTLVQRDKTVAVVEARDRVGGRILSAYGPSDKAFRYDLGPAWIWPHNHRMLDLVHRLDLPLMPQHATGNLVFQDAAGSIDRDLAFSTMAGALRVESGLSRIPEALAAGMPEETLNLGYRIDAAQLLGDRVRLSGAGPTGPFEVLANRAVFALPPRVLANRIAFEPRLSASVLQALAAVPTWMAPHTKVVAVYATPFWREIGLSGDAISHVGPLAEIHDASPLETADHEAALFGFVHPSALPLDPNSDVFRQKVVAQLVDLFGAAASHPLGLHTKAWAADPATSVPADRQALGGHPTYQAIQINDPDWRSKILLSGSETAPEHGGFLEGALEAAERTLNELT